MPPVVITRPCSSVVRGDGAGNRGKAGVLDLRWHATFAQGFFGREALSQNEFLETGSQRQEAGPITT